MTFQNKVGNLKTVTTSAVYRLREPVTANLKPQLSPAKQIKSHLAASSVEMAFGIVGASCNSSLMGGGNLFQKLSYFVPPRGSAYDAFLN